MIAATANSETAILTRLIDTPEAGLSPDSARYFLSLRFSEEDVARMNELSAKANEGTLTAAEDEEMLDHERVGHLLGILQSKSRKSLKRSGGN
jgi:hypothetical protein